MEKRYNKIIEYCKERGVKVELKENIDALSLTGPIYCATLRNLISMCNKNKLKYGITDCNTFLIYA